MYRLLQCIANLRFMIIALAFIDPNTLLAQAQCTLERNMVKSAKAIGATYFPSPGTACADAVGHLGKPVQIYKGFELEPRYTRKQLTGINVDCEFEVANSLNGPRYTQIVPTYYSCINDNGTVKSANSICKMANDCLTCDPSRASGSVPQVNPGDHSAGNPVLLAHGTNVERHLDWASNRETRFGFARYYSTQGDDISAPGFRSYGMGWTDEWTYVFMWFSTSGGKRFAYTPGGRMIGFKDYGNMTPIRADLPYTASLNSSVSPGEIVIKDGTGHEVAHILYGYSSGDYYAEYFPVRISWPDGYKITFSRDASGRILSASDNRGQRAEYTWNLDVTGRKRFDVLSKIEIDVDYDSVTFSPETRISYSYLPETASKFGRVLESVETVDIASSALLQSYTYEYDFASVNAAGTPPLSAVYDGRLDALGQPFANAEFEYGTSRSGPNNTTRATRSQHHGGASEFQFSEIGGTSAPAGAIEVTNPLGKKTQYLYDLIAGIKRPIQIDGLATASCLGTAKSFDYTPNSGAPLGYVYERIERNGAKTTFERNSRGLVLTRTEDADGPAPRVTTYTWHASLRLPLTRTTSQMKETFAYDADGLLTSYSQEDVLVSSPSFGNVRTWTYTYTALSSGLKVLTAIDGPGLLANGVTDVTTYSHNPDGTLASMTDPNGLITTYTAYDDFGNATRIVDPDGVAWSMTYDPEGQLLEVIENVDQSNANKTTFTYDIIGQMTSYTTPSNETWTLTHDEARRLVEIQNSAGESIHYTHDPAGNVTKTEYKGAGSVVTFFEDTAFDELGRIKTLLGAHGQTTAFTYDEEDNLKTATDALSLVTTNSYDALNRLTQIVDRASGTTLMDHDDADQVTEYTDPRGLDTDFTYNGFGEIVQEVSPDRGTISYSHDERGLVTSMTDARGIVSTYSYDDGGRITARSFPSSTGENQTFSYDGIANGSEGEGKVTQITDESGSTYREYADGGYVSLDRREIETKTYDTTYEVDGQGRLVKITTPGQLAISYTYDSRDRATQITVQREVIDPGTGQFPPAVDVISGVTYQPFGPVTGFTYADGATHTRSYDSSYRLTGLADVLGLTDLRDVDHTWTTRDNLSTASDTLNPLESESYQYSAREFLSQAVSDYGQIDYTYDATGNRASRAVTLGGSTTTDTYSYPATSNRLQSIALGTGGTRSLTYDAAGNVTHDNRGGGYGFAYNAANRMTSFSLAGVLQEEYLYNAMGQQVVRRMIQAGVTIHVVHDLEGNRLAEYEIDNSTGAQTLLQEYVWFDGAPVAVVDGQTDEIYLIRTDHIGRPVFATDDTGTKVWEASYLPFGGVNVTTGSPIALRFPGQWFHAEPALHQNWMRDYDPTTGRYLQTDPLGLLAGENLFGYALNSPLRYTDHTGENPLALCATPLGGLVCAAAGKKIVEVCIEGAKIVAGAAATLISSPSEACGCESKDPCKGLRRQLEEHRKKLSDYEKNPASMDNKGLLLRNPERASSIISGRIRRLKGQIANFERQLRECEEKNG